ncbi:MAG: hypothetical protein ACOCUT_00065 [bacterium]
MELPNIQAVIESAPKGANIVLEWTRPCKVRKAAQDQGEVSKSVRMIGRIGLTYDNLKSVQTKRATAELPEENQGLPSWSEWVQYPYLIRHKNNGTLYLRLYKGSSDKIKPRTRFMLNGKEVDFEAVEPMLLKSEKQSKEKADCFTVKIENLDKIYSDKENYGELVD